MCGGGGVGAPGGREVFERRVLNSGGGGKKECVLSANLAP